MALGLAVQALFLLLLHSFLLYFDKTGGCIRCIRRRVDGVHIGRDRAINDKNIAIHLHGNLPLHQQNNMFIRYYECNDYEVFAW